MLIAGLGFRAGAAVESLHEALALLGRQPGAVATARAKAGAPQMVTLARATGLPLIAVDVAGVDTPTQSAHVTPRFGTGSVAEAAALAAAGPGARLRVARVVSKDGMATAALAETAGGAADGEDVA